MRTPGRWGMVAASAAVLVLAGCTPDEPPPPDFPTAGTLTEADLPDGSWTGPYESWTDVPDVSRALRCSILGSMWSPSPPPVKEGTAVFADGETLVWSLGYEMSSEADAQELMGVMRAAEDCAPSTPDADYEFTLEDDGSTVVAMDRNSLTGDDNVIELAARQDGSTVVAVLVSYPAADPPDVTADSLLDRAVEVSADLQPVD